MLPSVFPRLAIDSAGRVFPDVWKPLLKFPSRDGLPFTGRAPSPTKDQSSLEPELRPSSGKYAFQKREREIYFNIKGTHGSKGMFPGFGFDR